MRGDRVSHSIRRGVRGLLAGVLVACWSLYGCGSAMKPPLLQAKLDEARNAYQAAGAAKANDLARQEFLQAERLLNEAIRRQQDGENVQSYQLALRAEYQADLARATADAARASQRLQLAQQGYVEAQLDDAMLRIQTAETLQKIAETYRSRAEADAKQSRQEADEAHANASLTQQDATTAIERARAEAEIERAAFLLNLALEANAATYARETHAEAAHLLAEAQRLFTEGDYRAARLKGMDAYRKADETRLVAQRNGDAEAKRVAQERFRNATNAAAEIGKARLLVEMAREAGGPSYAKTPFQQANSLLQQAVSLQEKETFDEATRLALQAQTVAKDARTVATAKAEQLRAQRRREESIAQVKDTILRTQRARDSLDEFSRKTSAKQLESVEGLLRLADLLLQEDKADLALVNAERAESIVQEAAQHAKDAQATEVDILDKAKNIENVQALVTTRGAVLRVTGDLFPVGRSDLSREFRPLVTRLAQILRPYVGKYRIAVEGHTDRSGNSNTNLLLSKGRAATIARYLTEDLGPSAQVTSEGYGDTQLIPDLSPSNAKNRRVEILLLTRFQP